MDTIRLDGRDFHGITQSLTARQETYILGHIRAASADLGKGEVVGALEIIGDLDGKKRTGRKRAEELLTVLMVSERIFQVMAGCLTEVGKKWAPAEADHNAERFSEITDTDEKQKMRVAITRFVIDFFQLGEPSSMSSQKSLSRSAKGRDTSSAAAVSSGSSLPSSESSPTTTPSDSTP